MIRLNSRRFETLQTGFVAGFGVQFDDLHNSRNSASLSFYGDDENRQHFYIYPCFYLFYLRDDGRDENVFEFFLHRRLVRILLLSNRVNSVVYSD